MLASRTSSHAEWLPHEAFFCELLHCIHTHSRSANRSTRQRLDYDSEEAMWADAKDELRQFDTTNGWEGPNEFASDRWGEVSPVADIATLS